MSNFDYSYIAKCKYDVPCLDAPQQVTDCREPAIAYVWWEDNDRWFVCEKHLDFLKEGRNDMSTRHSIAYNSGNDGTPYYHFGYDFASKDFYLDLGSIVITIEPQVVKAILDGFKKESGIEGIDKYWNSNKGK